ncbi:alpha/beta hydrolase [Paenibacillus glycanilyticus]|uniref:alpha/beta fold hydrolase n=1 Tax=Paenibacillus glycanilyticus TaxID=126569 RepID=UPI00203CC06C|nr:alpha/beta hydrolase [Paenibacillus glycanilyticus]MCM3626210.1 alpha/beta hydrolase [Paenibacillus glycanilyticus]
MAVAQVNRTSIYYETYGAGFPIVFVHGHGLTHEMFKPQIEYFSKEYQVIVCDLRGNGKSGKLTQALGDIIETQCLDLILLMNELRIGQAAFVGVSYGGLIVQHLAKYYKERVHSIIISDSFCRIESSTLTGKMQLAAAYCSWLVYFSPGELMLPATRLSYQRWSRAYSEVRKGMLDKRPIELYKQRLAASLADYSEHLKAIKQPALCLAGDFGSFGVDCMKEVVSRLPGARMKIIPDACDPSNLCQPDVFNEVVRQFLAEQLRLQEENAGDSAGERRFG